MLRRRQKELRKRHHTEEEAKRAKEEVRKQAEEEACLQAEAAAEGWQKKKKEARKAKDIVEVWKCFIIREVANCVALSVEMAVMAVRQGEDVKMGNVDGKAINSEEDLNV